MSRNAALRYDARCPEIATWWPLATSSSGHRDKDGPSTDPRCSTSPARILYGLVALWDAAAFGFKHSHQFKRIAVVT
jgi:hypothetical protein